jgi:hypothetical protein
MHTAPTKPINAPTIVSTSRACIKALVFIVIVLERKPQILSFGIQAP